MRDEHGAQELLVVEADDVGQLLPVDFFFNGFAIHVGDYEERLDGVFVVFLFEGHRPFRTIHASVVGEEGQLAIAELFAVSEDVAGIGGRQSVLLGGIRLSVDFDALVSVAFLLRVTWCAVVEGEADGVEYGRFAAAHRADDAEDAAFAQDTFFKVDDFATYFV